MNAMACGLGQLLVPFASAADPAPESLSNVIWESISTSGVLSPVVSVLLANNGIAYKFSAGDHPLSVLTRYTWRKTAPNAGTLVLGEGPNVGQTFVVFTSPRGGTFRDDFSAGQITFTPFPFRVEAPLRNISSRVALLATQPASVGFVVGGISPRRLLVRAIGPSLAQFGVSNAAANPVLSVFKGTSPVGANSGWGGTADLAATFAMVGAFGLPSGSRDCALLLTVGPGDYTAVVRSESGGEVLIEVYYVD